MARIVDKDERRAHILDAALRVFAVKGAVNLTIQDIAREAKVAKGTIYLYFDSKEAILHAILHHPTDDRDSLQALLSSPMSAKQKLRALVSFSIRSVLESSYPLELKPELWAAVIRSDQKSHLHRSVSETRSAVAALLEELGASQHRAGELAAGIISLLHGAIVLHVIHPEDFPFEKVMTTTFETLLAGIHER